MRLPLLLAAAVIVCGCSDRAGGFKPGHAIAAGAAVAVTPIEDVRYNRLPMPGTGQRMTAAVIAALEAEGLRPRVVPVAELPGGCDVIATARFREWAPDMVLVINALDGRTRDLVSSAEIQVDDADVGGRDRSAVADQLARDAVRVLVRPPERYEPPRTRGQPFAGR